MSTSGNKYQRIGDEEASTGIEIPTAAPVDGSSSSSGTQQQQQSTATENAFVVRVLYNEKTHEITGKVHQHSTIAELKVAIAEVTNMPVHRQRLIFNGKLLKPEDRTLSFFKVEDGFRIHLFPLPEAMPVTATAVPLSSSLGVTTAPNASAALVLGQFRSLVAGPTAAAALGDDRRDVLIFDPTIGQISREVKLWCIILMFLSALTLFNNFSYITSTGRFGVGILDSLVTVLDTFCSAAGLWIGNMGMQSVRTMELNDIRRYVSCLVVLAAFSIALRIAWVVDVVLQVHQLVIESQQAAADADDNSSSSGDKGSGDKGSGDKGNDGGGNDIFYFDNGDNNDAQDPVALDSSLVLTFGIQAGIIAFICIFAWFSCVTRARRLQTAVQNYGEAMQV